MLATGGMDGNVYESVAVSGGLALVGNNYGTINNSSVEISSDSVSLEELISGLRQTTKQCTELRDQLSTKSDTNDSIRGFGDDVEELETMVETLYFYIEENGSESLLSSPGWHRPLGELHQMVTSYRSTLNEHYCVLKDSGNPNEPDIKLGKDLKSDMRKLKLKLNIAIAVASFCACQSAETPQNREIEVLSERLHTLLEQIEDEKARRAGPGEPLNAKLLTVITHDADLAMDRFMARTIDTDCDTIREASMRVSTLIASSRDSIFTAPLSRSIPENFSLPDGPVGASEVPVQTAINRRSVVRHVTAGVPGILRSYVLGVIFPQRATKPAVYSIIEIAINPSHTADKVKDLILYAVEPYLPQAPPKDESDIAIRLYLGMQEPFAQSRLASYFENGILPKMICVVQRTTSFEEGILMEHIGLHLLYADHKSRVDDVRLQALGTQSTILPFGYGVIEQPDYQQYSWRFRILSDLIAYTNIGEHYYDNSCSSSWWIKEWLLKARHLTGRMKGPLTTYAAFKKSLANEYDILRLSGVYSYAVPKTDFRQDGVLYKAGRQVDVIVHYQDKMVKVASGIPTLRDVVDLEHGWIERDRFMIAHQPREW